MENQNNQNDKPADGYVQAPQQEAKSVLAELAEFVSRKKVAEQNVAAPAVEALLNGTEGDEKTGVKIVLKALEEPVRQIAANAGVEGSVIVENIKKSDKTGYGYNALTEEYGDMISFGIVDPTKVTRSALQNAASVAQMVLTTESLVADKKEPAPAAPAMPADGGMGGMY